MREITTQEYKLIVLNILVKIDELCRKHGLKYMIYYGTLLGAIRHGGFIPWDDDADIVMPRDDYNKLADIINNSNYGINFIRIEDNHDTIFPFGKICDTRTYLKQNAFRDVKGYGAFVDVFPCDHLYDDTRKRFKRKKHVLKLMKVAEHSSRVGYYKTPNHLTNFKRFLAFISTKMISTHYVVQRINTISTSLNKKNTKYIGLVWGKCFLKNDAFNHTCDVLFEGHLLKGPEKPIEHLEYLYNNWKNIPSNDEIKKCQHDFKCYYIDEGE